MSLANTIAYSTTAVPLLQFATWYSTIVVSNNTNGVAYVTLDGSTPTTSGASSGYPLAAGETQAFDNALNRPDADQKNPLGYGWTAQQDDDTYVSGFGTNVNVICATGTTSGNITAWPQ
jgi:hypothetical protein